MSWVCVLVSFFSFCSELYRFLLGFFCLGGFFFWGGGKGVVKEEEEGEMKGWGFRALVVV